jgi:hypothetical protein
LPVHLCFAVTELIRKACIRAPVMEFYILSPELPRLLLFITNEPKVQFTLNQNKRCPTLSTSGAPIC